MEIRVLPDQTHQVETIYPGQLQICDEEDGQREVFAVSVGRVPCEIFKGLLASPDEAEEMFDLLLGTGVFEEVNVVLVIFYDQNDAALFRLPRVGNWRAQRDRS